MRLLPIISIEVKWINILIFICFVANVTSRTKNRIVFEQWRSKGGGRSALGGTPGGGGILDKLYVIIFLNCFEQLLLGYISYSLIVNHLTVLPTAQAQSCGNGPRHLVYALVYSREYKKDLILMYIMYMGNASDASTLRK